MARTGRPPKPLEVKRRNGNPGKRALPAQSATIALEPVTETPQVPAHLDDAGSDAWVRIWQSPARAWLSPQVDFIRIETICNLVDDITKYRAMVNEMGPIIVETITANNAQFDTKIVANPLVKMLRDAEKQLDKELSAIGFDPTARARLGLAEVRRQSKLEELMAKRSSN